MTITATLEWRSNVYGEWNYLYWGGIWEDLMFRTYVVVVRTFPFHCLYRHAEIYVHWEKAWGKMLNKNTAIVHKSTADGWPWLPRTACSPEIKNGKTKMTTRCTTDGNLDGEDVGETVVVILWGRQSEGSMLRIVLPLCCRIPLGLNFHGLPWWSSHLIAGFSARVTSRVLK